MIKGLGRILSPVSRAVKKTPLGPESGLRVGIFSLTGFRGGRTGFGFSGLLEGYFQFSNFFPEGITVQSQEFCRLNLVSPGFVEDISDQRSLYLADQHGVKVSNPTPFHMFNKIAQPAFNKIL